MLGSRFGSLWNRSPHSMGGNVGGFSSSGKSGDHSLQDELNSKEIGPDHSLKSKPGDQERMSKLTRNRVTVPFSIEHPPQPVKRVKSEPMWEHPEQDEQIVLDEETDGTADHTALDAVKGSDSCSGVDAKESKCNDESLSDEGTEKRSSSSRRDPSKIEKAQPLGPVANAGNPISTASIAALEGQVEDFYAIVQRVEDSANAIKGELHEMLERAEKEMFSVIDRETQDFKNGVETAFKRYHQAKSSLENTETILLKYINVSNVLLQRLHSEQHIDMLQQFQFGPP